jgi:hypothetical protein
MAELNVLEAHNVIVEAIANDLSTIDDFTLSGITATNFDGHDSLGSAFYLYAYLKSGYEGLEFNLPPPTMLMWIQDKVQRGDLSPYIEKEAAALGLGIYALCKYHKGCPHVREPFASLIEPHFESNSGLYGNFLASVLVALGLRAVGSDASVLEGLESYIRYQLMNHANTVFNDPKNLVVAHMWAKEVEAKDIVRIIVNEALDRSSREDTLMRDRIYYSYVLFEEIPAVGRKDRRRVKNWIEASLSFIHSYSIESAFSPDIVEAYSGDVATTPGGMVGYGYAARPRLSRIMLSVGLLIDRKYHLEGSRLFSNEHQILRFARGVVYPLVLLGILSSFVYVSRKFGLPISIRKDVESAEFVRILKAVCLKLPLDVAWMSVVIIFLCWSACVFYYICWSARTDNEMTATNLTFAFLKQNWGVEVLLASVVALAASLSGLGG